MIVNPLPPQAYTKETLQKAYAWLLNQSPSIKDMASTQDMLISLYLKAQRSGEASLDTPSIQNFKQELKNLASMIGDLQTPSASAAVSATSIPINTPAPSVSTPVHNKNNGLSEHTQVFKEASPNVAGSKQTIQPSTNGSNQNLGQLDLQSLQILAEVRQYLNLSSDLEALRSLISLGYKQIKKMN